MDRRDEVAAKVAYNTRTSGQTCIHCGQPFPSYDEVHLDRNVAPVRSRFGFPETINLVHAHCFEKHESRVGVDKYEIAIGKLDQKNLASEAMLTVEFWNSDAENYDGIGDEPKVMLIHMASNGWDFKGRHEIDNESLFIWQRKVAI